MNYKFPVITNISDVLPHIKGRKEFIVAEKDGYKVVNYVVALEDSFGDHNTLEGAMRRECRGLVFNNYGGLINRRYHKFFNLGEKPETQPEVIDFDIDHTVLEKLDGSMVSPVYIYDDIRWITKMGITDTSMNAEVFVAKNPKYEAFAKMCLDVNLTPIFEWCSNKNRIVLDQQEDSLILTALRSNPDGIYYDINIGKTNDIPIVQPYKHKNLSAVKHDEDTEGVVVRFINGHMIKVKTDWYLTRHRVKDNINNINNLLELLIQNKEDDVLPLLSKEDVARVQSLKKDLFLGVEKTARDYNLYEKFITDHRFTRKDVALNLKDNPKTSLIYPRVVFNWFDENCTRTMGDVYKDVVNNLSVHDIKRNKEKLLPFIKE